MMRRVVLRLARDRRGASLVELALIAPMLLTLFAGILDCGRLFAAKLNLQQVAERSVELATMSGISTQTYQVVQTNMQADATSAAPAASQIVVSFWLECNGVKQGDFNASCNTGEQVARYASLSIASSYTPTFPWLFGPLVANGKIAVNSAASVRVQ
jgi:Flp pilus assembly protein TadG